MNTRFQNYVAGLTAAKQSLVMEAIQEYLKGDSEAVTEVTSATKVFQLCRDLALEDEEHAVILLLKSSGELIKRVELCKGSQTETCFDVRAIFREALLGKATQIIMVHNHPSGSLKPSSFDDQLTERARKAGEVLTIPVRDHVIIANGDYYSYKEHGKM